MKIAVDGRLVLVFVAAIVVGGCGGGSDTSSGHSSGPTAPKTVSLTVTKAGSGTVSFNPAGNSCGTDCRSYASGMSVTLSASAASGYAFDGWSGSGISCSGTGNCIVSMTASSTVAANFTQTSASQNTLTVTVSGSGTVTSSPSGINCGSSCSGAFDSTTSVTMTAVPGSGYTFSGWSGACSGTGGCTVSMSTTRNVSATFSQNSSPGGSANLTIPAGHPRLMYSNSTMLSQARVWYAGNKDQVSWSDNLFPISMNGLRAVLSQDASYCNKPIDSSNPSSPTPISWVLNSTCFRQYDGVDGCQNIIDNSRWNGEEIVLVFDFCHDAMTPDQRQQLINKYNPLFAQLNVPGQWGDGAPSNNYFWGFMRNSIEWGIATYGENDQAQSFIDDGIVRRFEGQFIPFAATAGPNKYSTSGGKGGVPAEGTNYGRYQLQYPTIPFVSAGLMGKALYNETNWFKESVFYQIYTTTPAPTVISTAPASASYQVFAFNDDDVSLDGHSAENGYVGQFMTIAATLWKDINIGMYARQFLNTVSPTVPNIAKSVDLAGSPKDFSLLPLDYYAPGIANLFTRDKWGPSATSVLVQMNEEPGIGGHYHNADYGVFQIWRGTADANSGRWLSRGTYSYGDYIAGLGGVNREFPGKALGGNALVFEGLGAMASPPPVSYSKGPGIVQRLESRDAYSYAAVDLTNLYRSTGSSYFDENYYWATGTVRLRDDNPHVKKIVREFVFIRPLETLVVFDRMESTAYDRTDVGLAHLQKLDANLDPVTSNGVPVMVDLPVTTQISNAESVRKTFLVHFEQAPTKIADNVYEGVNGPSALRVTTLVPATVSSQVVNERNVGLSKFTAARGAQYRLELTQSGQAQSHFLNVLQAKDSGGMNSVNLNISLQETASEFQVTLTHPNRGTAIIVFNKGTTSTGGQFGYSASGTPTLIPLIDHVQSIQVTDSGPNWVQ